MLRTVGLVLVAVMLSGCGNPDQVYGLGVIPQNVTGDENSVSVFNVWSGGDALPLAERHCQQYDKSAVFERMMGITAEFSCA